MEPPPTRRKPTLKNPDEWKKKTHDRLACLVQSANPLLKCGRSCITGEPNMSHLREHLRIAHTCDCDPSGPCQNLLHLSDAQILLAGNITQLRHKSPRDTWKRTYQALYPGRESTPSPVLPSWDQLVAIARNRTDPMSLEYGRRVREYRNQENGLEGVAALVEDPLELLSIYLDLLREWDARESSSTTQT